MRHVPDRQTHLPYISTILSPPASLTESTPRPSPMYFPANSADLRLTEKHMMSDYVVRPCSIRSRRRGKRKSRSGRGSGQEEDRTGGDDDEEDEAKSRRSSEEEAEGGQEEQRCSMVGGSLRMTQDMTLDI